MAGIEQRGDPLRWANFYPPNLGLNITITTLSVTENGRQSKVKIQSKVNRMRLKVWRCIICILLSLIVSEFEPLIITVLRQYTWKSVLLVFSLQKGFCRTSAAES